MPVAAFQLSVFDLKYGKFSRPRGRCGVGLGPTEFSAVRAYIPYRRRKFETVVLHQAHAVPVHQWPGGGQAGQHAAWSSSPWLAMDEPTLIPADYYGADPTTVRDAVRAFSDDLLAPLLNGVQAAGERVQHLVLGHPGRAHAGIPAGDPAVSRLHSPRPDRSARPESISGSRTSLAPPRRGRRRLAQRKPDRPARLAAIMPAVDLPLRPLSNPSPQQRQSAGRGRQRPPSLRRHILRRAANTPTSGE